MFESLFNIFQAKQTPGIDRETVQALKNIGAYNIDGTLDTSPEAIRRANLSKISTLIPTKQSVVNAPSASILPPGPTNLLSNLPKNEPVQFSPVNQVGERAKPALSPYSVAQMAIQKQVSNPLPQENLTLPQKVLQNPMQEIGNAFVKIGQFGQEHILEPIAGISKQDVSVYNPLSPNEPFVLPAGGLKGGQSFIKGVADIATKLAYDIRDIIKVRNKMASEGQTFGQKIDEAGNVIEAYNPEDTTKLNSHIGDLKWLITKDPYFQNHPIQAYSLVASQGVLDMAVGGDVLKGAINGALKSLPEDWKTVMENQIKLGMDLDKPITKETLGEAYKNVSKLTHPDVGGSTVKNMVRTSTGFENLTPFEDATKAKEFLESKLVNGDIPPISTLGRKYAQVVEKLNQDVRDWFRTPTETPYTGIKGLLTRKAGMTPAQSYQEFRQPNMGLSVKEVPEKSVISKIEPNEYKSFVKSDGISDDLKAIKELKSGAHKLELYHATSRGGEKGIKDMWFDINEGGFADEIVSQQGGKMGKYQVNTNNLLAINDTEDAIIKLFGKDESKYPRVIKNAVNPDFLMDDDTAIRVDKLLTNKARKDGYDAIFFKERGQGGAEMVLLDPTKAKLISVRDENTGKFIELPSNKPTIPKIPVKREIFKNKLNESGKIEPKVYKGEKELTTKFLNYAKGKETLSRQEILDFAKRPELKKGEADLLVKKLEEFESKKPLLQGQKLYSISEDIPQIDSYIQKEWGGKIPDNELVNLGTVEDIILNKRVKDIFKDVLDVQITMTEKFERPTIQAQIGKLPNNKLQIQIKRGLTEEKFNRSLTEELLHALRIRKGRTSYNDEQLLNYLERPTEKSAKIAVEKLFGEDFFGLPIQKRYSAQEFADSIRRDLLELKPVKVKEPQYSRTTIEQPHTKLLDNGKVQPSQYEEVVFESPITTNGSSHFPNSKNYFAHARGDEVVEGGKRIWREQEIQSDLLQKDNFEKTLGKDISDEELKVSFERAKAKGHYTEEGVKRRMVIEMEAKANREQLSPFTNDRFGERIMRERIKEKASKGYEKYRLPTGETIGKIEGFNNNEVWIEPDFEETGAMIPFDFNNMKIGDELANTDNRQNWIIIDIFGDGRFKAVPKDAMERNKITLDEAINDKEIRANLDNRGVAETFDLTGKSNPQYRRYQDWGKFLKNKYGGKEITDPQGNSWVEIDLKPEYKKMPIEAFGIAPLLTLANQKNKKEETNKSALLKKINKTKLPELTKEQKGKVIATVFAEGVGESEKGIQGILNTMVNRANNPNKNLYGGNNLFNVVSKPYQYTGFSVNNPLYIKIRDYYRGKNVKLTDEQKSKLKIIENLYSKANEGKLEDVTKGALYYVNPSVKGVSLAYYNKRKSEKKIDNQVFFNL